MESSDVVEKITQDLKSRPFNQIAKIISELSFYAVEGV